jgi:cyclopropane-fatty-acyl-phospholipid synthase
MEERRAIMSKAIAWAEQGRLPDAVVKYGIRRLLLQRINELPADPSMQLQQYTSDLIRELKHSPIALETKAANQQHYEVPSQFFKLSLGKHLKYSSAYYDKGAKNLDQAEEHMLALTAERAEIHDGMKIMDLGCGWGSFSLWAAGKFPGCTFKSVSNSSSQREYIESQAAARGLKNIEVITADMNSFDVDETFDRIVSVEMFEHMRNYEKLMAKTSGWLKPDGRLFVHIFCHKTTPYYFETAGDDNWMGAHFFTGGIMPSNHLLLYFQDHMAIDQHWVVNGTNYQKTSLAWLENTDKHKQEIIDLFENTYGTGKGNLWYQRWRIFYLSCAELFGYRKGREWWVSHYLFKKR